MLCSIASILSGTSPNNIDLQVAKIHSPSASNKQSHYKLTLSDGQHTIIGALHLSLSHLVKSQAIKDGAIIRIGQWKVSTLEAAQKQVLCVNSNVSVIGHERVRNAKTLVECPDVNIPTASNDEKDDGSIGPVSEASETPPPSKHVVRLDDWPEFNANGLKYVTMIGNSSYAYVEIGSEPLVDVHALAPARKVDVYDAVVIQKDEEPAVGYCKGYTCSYGDREGTIVAIVWLRNKRIINLAIREPDGYITFRSPSPGEITAKQYRVTVAMRASWQHHLDSATAGVNAAKEKRASRLKTVKKTVARPSVDSVDNSDTSDSEEPAPTKGSKRKREVAPTATNKKQRTDKQLFHLGDNLEDTHPDPAFASIEDITKLRQQLARVNQQLEDQQLDIATLRDEIGHKSSKIKELVTSLAVLREDLETAVGNMTQLNAKINSLKPTNREPSYQSPEKIVYMPAPRQVETRYVPVPEYYPPEPHINRTPSRFYPYH